VTLLSFKKIMQLVGVSKVVFGMKGRQDQIRFAKLARGTSRDHSPLFLSPVK
jgi:hypothetical protein